MRHKKVVVWWLVTGQRHRLLTDSDRKAHTLRHIADALFPGINYEAVDFDVLMQDYARPALKKQFAQLALVPAEEISNDPTAEVEIQEFIPTEGYEWQDSATWKAEFGRRLTA